MGITTILANPAVAVLLPAVLRNVAGWLEHSLKDGKISKYELKLLGSTVIRTGMQSLALVVGTGSPYAGYLAILTDAFVTKLKKD